MKLNFSKEEKQYLKKICIDWNAQYLIVDGVRVIIPLDKWRYEDEKLHK